MVVRESVLWILLVLRSTLSVERHVPRCIALLVMDALVLLR